MSGGQIFKKNVIKEIKWELVYQAKGKISPSVCVIPDVAVIYVHECYKSLH